MQRSPWTFVVKQQTITNPVHRRMSEPLVKYQLPKHCSICFQWPFTQTGKKKKKMTTARVEVTFITSSRRKRIAASCISPAKHPSTSKKANYSVTPEPLLCRQGHSPLDQTRASSVAEEIMWKHIKICSKQSSFSVIQWFSKPCNKTNQPKKQ